MSTRINHTPRETAPEATILSAVLVFLIHRSSQIFSGSRLDSQFEFRNKKQTLADP